VVGSGKRFGEESCEINTAKKKTGERATRKRDVKCIISRKSNTTYKSLWNKERKLNPENRGEDIRG